MSDLHIGANNVDHDWIKRELEDAREHGDRILLNGDIFDLILPVDHKRFQPDALHPRLRGRRDILNAALEWGAELLSPYTDLIDMIGIGNHETAVEKHHTMDVVLMLVDKLNSHAKDGHVVHYGGYTGYVCYQLARTFRKSGGPGDCRRLVIYYHHGSGGSAPVTKGMIDLTRKAAWVDSDVIWLGHKHNRISDMSGLRLRCPQAGETPIVDQQVGVMTGAYMTNYSGQTQADVKSRGRRAPYSADLGLAPQYKGGARLFVRLDREGRKVLRLLQ